MKPYRAILICAALAVLTFASFWPVKDAGFISYDDRDYVVDNVIVQRGLTFEGLRWALTTGYAGNWHPVTWISHMVDAQLFGDSARAPHLVSVCIHLFNALLLLGLFQKMTGALWRSAIVAALFALHPLHVESVAWVSERKDVLSTFWALLSTWCYVAFAQAKKPHTQRRWYSAAAVFLALGLMSKPMLVTLPCLFLLLDFWPLNRITLDRLKPLLPQLIKEKFVFVALAVMSCFITFFVQQAGGAVQSMSEFGVWHRLANALFSYVVYLRKTLWPSDLAIFYPHPNSFAAWQIIGAIAVLAAVSILAWSRAKTRPYLLMGWLWFVGALVPVIGIVQVGEQALADRYTYLPLVGIFVIGTWGVADLLSKANRITPIITAVVLCCCSILTWRQADLWKNSETLFIHAVRVTKDNYLAHNHLATDCLHNEKIAEAKTHLELAVKYRPDFADARANLGSLLAQEGKLAEAKIHLTEAVRSNFRFEQAHYNLGNLFKAEGDFEKAAEHFAVALEINPDNADAHNGLAYILAKGGQMPQAITHYSEATRLRPTDATTRFNLATALLSVGETNYAVGHYAAAIKLQPDFLAALYQLGIVLAEQGRVEEARNAFTQIVRIQPDFADAQQRLGALPSRPAQP